MMSPLQVTVSTLADVRPRLLHMCNGDHDLRLAGASTNATFPPSCIYAAGTVGNNTLFIYGGMQNATM